MPDPVQIVYCGGTIGSDGTPLAPLPAGVFTSRFQAAVAAGALGSGPLPPIRWRGLEPPIDSTDAVPADWARIALAVIEGAQEGERAAGSIVLHGTDTLANSAAALALLTTLWEAGAPSAVLAAPVVVTGSMRPMFEGAGLRPGTDAPGNLATAFDAVADGAPGVWVAFAGATMPGDHVLKVDTRADAAFAIPTPHSAPAETKSHADPAALLVQLTRLSPHLGAKAVPIFAPQPESGAAQAAVLTGLVNGLRERLGGLILAGFGQGNLPAAEDLAPILSNLAQRGVPVVISTQVPAGGVASEAYAAGAWLADCGVIVGGCRTLPAIHATVHVALALAAAEGWDRDQTTRLISREMAR
ncbi:MAG: asparaginase domain-containing protein [Pseudomonadota bacterium]